MSGKCEACGVVWKEHLGIMGTCQQLQNARKRHKQYLKHIDRLIREREEARAEIERLKQQLGDADKSIVENWSIDDENARLRAEIKRLQAIADTRRDELIDTAAQADWRAGEIERLEANQITPEIISRVAELHGEIDRLATENRTHVATIACVMEQAKSAAKVYQAEIERLSHNASTWETSAMCEADRRQKAEAEVERLRATCCQLEQDSEYNAELARERDTEIDGLRAGIAAIAEELSCEQKAGTICSEIRGMRREIERLRNAIQWLRTRMECIRSDRAIYAHILRDDFEQFEAMVQGKDNT